MILKFHSQCRELSSLDVTSFELWSFLFDEECRQNTLGPYRCLNDLSSLVVCRRKFGNFQILRNNKRTYIIQHCLQVLSDLSDIQFMYSLRHYLLCLPCDTGCCRNTWDLRTSDQRLYVFFITCTCYNVSSNYPKNLFFRVVLEEMLCLNHHQLLVSRT